MSSVPAQGVNIQEATTAKKRGSPGILGKGTPGSRLKSHYQEGAAQGPDPQGSVPACRPPVGQVHGDGPGRRCPPRGGRPEVARLQADELIPLSPRV
jgi:hypothetical protein